MNNIVHAFVRLSDDPSRCYFVKNCPAAAMEIVNLKLDDTLNIRGLGRLLVVEIVHAAPYEDEHGKVHIYTILCKWLHDAYVEVRK